MAYTYVISNLHSVFSLKVFWRTLILIWKYNQLIIIHIHCDHVSAWKCLWCYPRMICLLLKAAKYEIQKPSTCPATLFRCKFLSMFPVFHLTRSTWPATKTFVAGWRKVLRKVERWSTFFYFFHQTHNLSRNKCRHIRSTPSKSTNQRAAFLQHATNVFAAEKVERARWKTGNIDENLERNNVARQVEGFCISYFAAFSYFTSDFDRIPSKFRRFDWQICFLLPKERILKTI